MFTLDGASQHAVAFESRYARNGRGAPSEMVPPLKAQSGQSGKGDAAPLILSLAQNQRGELRTSDIAMQLTTGGGKPGEGYPAVALRMGGDYADPYVSVDDQAFLAANPMSDRQMAVHGGLPGMSVRRLTPRECERLQGFPDDWTAIQYRGKAAADGPRYRALGNSMAVPVLRWILRRIAAFEAR